MQCWGKNEYGQLGDGTRENRKTPVDVNGLTNGVKAVTAGRDHTCALLENGRVKCWGTNGSGQLGDSTTEERTKPVLVGELTGVKAVSAGDGYTCALLEDGAVMCWGGNGVGQLGDGTGYNRTTPVAVADLAGSVKAIAAGSGHTCALLDSGDVQCWGANWDGALGSGRDYRTTPVYVVGLEANTGPSFTSTPVLTATEGITYTYAVTATDPNAGDAMTITTSANPAWTSLADQGGGAATLSGVPAASDYGEHAVALLVTDSEGLTDTQSFTITVMGAGSVQGVVFDDDNENGKQDGDEEGIPGVQVTLSNTSTVASASAAAFAMSAVTDAEGNFAFSGVPTGECVLTVEPPLGWQTPEPQTVTVTAGAPDGGIAGSRYPWMAAGVLTCAAEMMSIVRANLDLYLGCHPATRKGNTPMSRRTVRQIVIVVICVCVVTVIGYRAVQAEEIVDPSAATSHHAVQIAAGGAHACALTEAGGVKCWGSNADGQLGIGKDESTVPFSNVPVDVVGLGSGVKGVFAGTSHTCAVMDTGGVKCWGANWEGQLNDGTRESRTAPVDVIGLSNVKQIAAGASAHLCADRERRRQMLGRKLGGPTGRWDVVSRRPAC